MLSARLVAPPRLTSNCIQSILSLNAAACTAVLGRVGGRFESGKKKRYNKRMMWDTNNSLSKIFILFFMQLKSWGTTFSLKGGGRKETSRKRGRNRVW